MRAPLLEGTYHASVNITDGDGSAILGSSPFAPFYVNTTSRAIGIVDLEADVEVDGQTIARLGRRDGA
jgi:hypothetical protein